MSRDQQEERGHQQARNEAISVIDTERQRLANLWHEASGPVRESLARRASKLSGLIDRLIGWHGPTTRTREIMNEISTSDATLAEGVRLYTRAELEEASMQAAGAAAGVFLRAQPDLVMPSTEVAEAAQAVLDSFDREFPPAEDLCEAAWGIIANAHGGNWDEASEEWREAAERWRDGWHRLLDRTCS